MIGKVQPVRGTKDLFGQEYLKCQHILDTAQKIITCYGYTPLITPLFEYTSVFKRPLGETSDIVGKEMYTFTDRGGEEITFRPEGTAGVIRAILSNGFTQKLPLKVSYSGPMLRYERPQKGRYRQFQQMGVEYLGGSHPQVDAEIIALGYEIMKALKVDQSIEVQVNTIGDSLSRNAWRQALIDYFTPFSRDLSQESQARLHRNPLRILDSKDLKDQEIVAHCPPFQPYLTQDSLHFFEDVCHLLGELGVPYTLNPHLVRGLDYYTHTAFEFVTKELGAQGTVLAGGRYDGLVQQMGGDEIPGVGWAMGVERLALMIQDREVTIKPLCVITLNDGEEQAFLTAMQLRNWGFFVDFIPNSSFIKGMKRANKVNAPAAVIVGGEELKQKIVLVKNMETGAQSPVSFDHLPSYLEHHFPNTQVQGGNFCCL